MTDQTITAGVVEEFPQPPLYYLHGDIVQPSANQEDGSIPEPTIFGNMLIEGKVHDDLDVTVWKRDLKQ